MLRTNVMSAEGKIKGYWTTPNRVPHKNMWLWDSVFHALGWQYYDVSLAYRAIEAMLEIQYEDGLIPIMATPYEALMLTQPPLLAWGIWKLYERCGDQKLINNSYEKLKKYITWNLTHRDSNKNFLFEWLISATGSGESGADNPARFDLRKTMDCVDFSSFMAKEVQTLSKMAKLLGEKDDEKYYQELFNCIQKAVNELLWDEETKTFRDRFLDGVVNKNVI
ncbi:trehalase family glycosidase [Ruthenibacterium lactatiformans]|uniref:MGH1-like glycoside hydrolase domain-containing protein n=1 Tax=Ruthenibacterium lactatiformans TaxID=1550024 RepID=UPI0024958F7E|nr:trehalase family glycosidase [Ruthenibacterium lactatiformans]